MAAPENTAVLRQLVDAFNGRDFAAADRLYASGYVNHDPPPFAKERPETHGTSGMRGLAAGVGLPRYG